MNSYRPYLIRALYDWICDNGLTPHLLVDAHAEGVSVPASAIDEGRVVLNIAPRAVVGFDIDQEWIRFSARFGGVSHDIWVPIAAVLAIYARENGQGMVIPDDPRPATEAELELRVSELAEDDPAPADPAAAPVKPRPSLAAVPTESSGDDEPVPPSPGTEPSAKGKGFLRVVK